MTKDRIKEYIREMRKLSLNGQNAMVRDTLRRMEAELDSKAPPKIYYDSTDPGNPWGSESKR